MNDGREHRLYEMCPKCGASPRPIYHEAGCFYVGNGRPPDAASLMARSKLHKCDHDHLWFICPCGYSWEGPTRDAGSEERHGIIILAGYDIVRDDKAPACPIGWRIVKQ